MTDPKEVFLIIGQYTDDGSVVTSILPRVHLDPGMFGDILESTISLKGRILMVEEKHHMGVVHRSADVTTALQRAVEYFDQ